MFPQVTVEVVLVVLSVLLNGNGFCICIIILPCIPSIVRFFLEFMLLLLEMESFDELGPMLLQFMFPKLGFMLEWCGGGYCGMP